MNSVHSYLVKTKFVKAKELPIPALSLKGEQANPIKYVKAKELPIPAQLIEHEK